MAIINSYRDLHVYQNAMVQVMNVFKLTKKFPSEEKYSLTDQVRRSSRSVCANLAEAWRKRRYAAALVAKLSDAETEAAESQVWAEVAWRHGYITEDEFKQLDAAYETVMAQIVRMDGEPEKWLIKASPRKQAQ